MLSCSAGLSSTTSSRLRRGVDVLLDAVQRRLQPFRSRRLGHESKRAAGQAMMPVFIQSQHLHRDVPRCGILFQVIEHGPTQHVGQEDVERNCGRMEFAGQSQRFRAAHRDQHLESFVVRQIAKNAGVVRIIFDDQQDRIVRLQIGAVVGNALDRPTPTRQPRDSWRGNVTVVRSAIAALAADGPT